MMKYPQMRNQLIAVLRSLSDLQYQRECWVKGNCPPGITDNFDLSVHFLFDDTDLEFNSRNYIGIILEDESEVEAFSRVIASINRIFEKHGTLLSDSEYICLEEWSDVLDTSRLALSVLLTKCR